MKAMTPGWRKNPYKAENTNHNGNDLKPFNDRARQ